MMLSLSSDLDYIPFFLSCEPPFLSEQLASSELFWGWDRNAVAESS